MAKTVCSGQRPVRARVTQRGILEQQEVQEEPFLHELAKQGKPFHDEVEILVSYGKLRRQHELMIAPA